jgi:predicted O-linked N-acetylglucosamine transferase (SPINDLY family)
VAAAQAVASWRPDVLIDLAGHTGGGRLRILAYRPAPVQMSWLGYFDTTGMRSVDHVIADPVAVPAELEKYFSEKVLRLPHGFVCFDPPAGAPEPGPLPALANGFITFGSQNQLAKITDDVVLLWAGVLQRVPTARLFFQARAFNDRTARERYAKAFAGLGVDPERIDFLPATSPQGMLANYGRFDIALDPFPCTGGTTTCESLWMGVPVVTLLGDRFGGRHSASHINNVGLGQLIAASPEQYLDIAVSLAADTLALAEIRQGLRGRMRVSPLCDGQRFANDFADLLLGVLPVHE